MNNFTLKVPSINYQKTISLKVVCGCKKSKPAKNFKQLVALVKQAEEILIKNGHKDMEDRIHILRGIYYGTEWSVDYKNEKSTARNTAFNLPYTGHLTPKDARKELKCFKDCNADLYDSLFASYEVFDSKYKAVDFGHLIIGLDARRSVFAKNIPIPTQGGTGLEICTWVGDLGGGVGNLATKRVNNPKIRGKTLFPVHGHSYGSMANLEGDIAAYVVGMNDAKPSKIVNSTDHFPTIHYALEDYFNCKWDTRTLHFLKMIGGVFSEANELKNRKELEKNIAENFNDFAYWYLGIRMKDKNIGDLEDFRNASFYFKPISLEVASIFIDGLLHVIKKPQDMITARTNPDPKPKNRNNIKKTEDAIIKVKDFFKNLNPFD